MPKFDILSLDQLSSTPYCGYAIRVNGWLIEEDFADDSVPMVSWEDRAVVALAQPTALPIGIITWTKVEWQKEAAIKLGYVHPTYRRHGVYRLLWQKLVEDAKAQGMLRIGGQVKINNGPMREVLKKTRTDRGIGQHRVLPLGKGT